jgi:uncharacterized membrane protein
MARRWLYGVLVVLAISLLVGTGGFSSAAADRGVDVTVVDDDSAFLGITLESPVLDNGRHDETQLASVQNRFGVPLTDLEVTVDGDDPQSPKLLPQSTPDVDVPDSIAPGESGTIEADIQCSNAGGDGPTEDWQLHISATSDVATVDLTRTVTVECTGEGSGKPDGSQE